MAANCHRFGGALRSGTLIVLKAAGGLDAKKVWQAAFVIERVIGGVGQNLLLLRGIGRRCLSLAWAEEQQGDNDRNGGAPKEHYSWS